VIRHVKHSLDAIRGFPNGVVAPMPSYPNGYQIEQVGHHPAD
jgi:hypothetical protein